MDDERFTAPPPPGVGPVRPLPLWRYLVIGVLVIGLIAAAVLIPIPVVFLYVPGPVRDVEGLVEASNAKTYSSEGTLLMTTVSVDTSVTFVELVAAWLDAEQDVVMRDQVTGGQPLDVLRRQQRAQMRESQSSATQVALTALGLDHPTGDGAEVVRVIEGSPAAAFLKVDDVIVGIENREVETTCDVGAAIHPLAPGERVTVSYRRGGTIRTDSARLAQSPFEAGAFLGVEMRTINFSFSPGVDVDFETGRIAGPSAGLILALALYDQLTPEDLTAGRAIAGTGTVDCDGDVGAIGGIRQKVAGARKEGAEIFLVPRANAADARTVADGIEIVPIASFQDALGYLTGLST